MGCESSRSVAVDNTIAKTTENRELRERLTDLQVDVIKSTWPILSKDMEETGVRLMRDVFTTEPLLVHIFPFRGLTIEQQESSPKFREISHKIMKVFSMVTDSLEENVDDSKEISDTLLMLGAKHASFKGFDPVYFITFQKSLHSTWEWMLGEEYIEEVREAWDVVFDYVINKLTYGYKCYIADKENEPTVASPNQTIDSLQE